MPADARREHRSVGGGGAISRSKKGKGDRHQQGLEGLIEDLRTIFPREGSFNSKKPRSRRTAKKARKRRDVSIDGRDGVFGKIHVLLLPRRT